MEFLKDLRLYNWYTIMLLCGIALVASSFAFNITFVDPRHIFGLGLGAATIGLTYIAARKNVRIEEGHGYYQGKVPILTAIHIFILVIGWGVLIVFAGLLLWSLA